MKCPLNVDVHTKKTLSIGFVALLLLVMAAGVTATPWGGTPNDPTPAQAIWVDPKNTTGLAIDDIFTVDVLINITDPAGPATGMWGWQYCLQWNSTVLNAVEVQTHGDNIPAGDLMPGHTLVMVADNTTTAQNHTYLVIPLMGSAFAGVNSLCTYKFKVMWQPPESAPDFCGLLDLIEAGPKMVKVTDDTAGLLIQGSPAIGTIVDGMYCIDALSDITPPTIGDPSRTPSGDVQPLQDVKVFVNVTDAGTGVKNVTLPYTITNGTTWESPLTMTLNATSGLYEATIPGQSAWTWVKFNITAYDYAENKATRDGEAEYFVYQVIPEFPTITMLLLLMIAALVAVVLGKTVQLRKRRRPFVVN